MFFFRKIHGSLYTENLTFEHTGDVYICQLGINFNINHIQRRFYSRNMIEGEMKYPFKMAFDLRIMGWIYTESWDVDLNMQLEIFHHVIQN